MNDRTKDFFMEIQQADNMGSPLDDDRVNCFKCGKDITNDYQHTDTEDDIYCTDCTVAKINHLKAELTTLREAVKNYLMIKSGWSAAYDSTQDVYNAYLEQIAQAEQALREAVGV
jgi:predicted RNA-binding Zn ribbon-like protein